jgi:ADP-heptose:LPS heptosyltransferase
LGSSIFIANLIRFKSIGLETYPNSSLKFRLAFVIVDYFLHFLLKKIESINQIRKPRSILIVNGAHIGDVLLSTSLIPLLRSSFPDAKIGLLVGSWSLLALSKTNIVDEIHVVDHYRLNRTHKSIYKKIWQFILTARSAINELHNCSYDVAINLYAKPNIIPLLWLSGIPNRIGYVNGGFGPLLTHPFQWKNSDLHITAYHLELLTALDLKINSSSELNYVIPKPTSSELDSLYKLFGGALAIGMKYTIIHIGTGEEKREWPRERWRDLSIELILKGDQLVFTGYGEREANMISWITDGLENCINLCGILDWRQFVSVISKASIVYCVESVASHVSAALGTPCIAVWSGLNKPKYFKPLGNLTKTLTANVECIGCLRGCAEMRCVREVSVKEVSSISLSDFTAPRFV